MIYHNSDKLCVTYILFFYNVYLGIEYSQIAHTMAVTRYNIHEGLRVVDSRTQIQGLLLKKYRESTFQLFNLIAD